MDPWHNKPSFKVAPVRAEYQATFANDTFIGARRQNGQPPAGLPVVLKRGSKLDVKAASLFAEYQADLGGKTLTGQWTQGPRSLPLTLKKK